MYMRQIIMERPVNEYNEKYCGLVAAPFPLNLLVTPFIPFYFT